ncbi:T9SS type A sorting domain-containing protein [Parafilimonas sp.]|uniref:T9SS type A sorting domain-containing protein n=1 Tax=Parafilimonas sp. TaxID=1969739 RepID=UPI0039E3A71A
MLQALNMSSSLPQLPASAISFVSAQKTAGAAIGKRAAFGNLKAYANSFIRIFFVFLIVGWNALLYISLCVKILHGRFISNFISSFPLPVKGDAEIYDLSGKLLYQNRLVNLFKGNNSVAVKPQKGLSSGLYMVKLTAPDTMISKTIRITKQH